MLDVAGHQVMRIRGLSAFQKDVVIGVGAGMHGLRGSHLQRCFVNGSKRGINHRIAERKHRTM